MEEIREGDIVKILGMEECLSNDRDYFIDDICEVKSINNKDYEDDTYTYLVYTIDKSSFWYFEREQLEKITHPLYSKG